MTTGPARNPFDSWLPDDTEALPVEDAADPWGEDDAVEVELTDAQRAFLATLADQPERTQHGRTKNPSSWILRRQRCSSDIESECFAPSFADVASASSVSTTASSLRTSGCSQAVSKRRLDRCAWPSASTSGSRGNVLA